MRSARGEKGEKMSKYIDAERLTFVIKKNFGHGTISPILQLIDEQPTADVRENVKGEWIEDAIANNIYRCSECGIDAPVEPTRGTEYKSNYCPNCGADMRGEQNDTI